MAGKVVNSSFVLLNKFGASRQERALKTATSHIRKTLQAVKKTSFLLDYQFSQSDILKYL